MVSSILEARGGPTMEVQDDARDGQVSYNTGGFSYTSRLGRVDTAQAEFLSDSMTAKVTTIQSNNEVVVQLFSAGTTNEVDDGQSVETNISLTAYRL